LISEPTPASRGECTTAALAPRWHTAALIALLLAVALTGTLLQYSGAPHAVAGPPGSRISTQYLPILLVNWGLFVYCVRVFRGRNALRALLGEGWRTTSRAGADLALAFAGFVVIVGLELSWSRLFPVGRNAALSTLLPCTGTERLTWLLVALSVGFCEEVVYRGYLQTQLTAFTRQPALGVLLQALLFGVAHLEQGPGAALRIAVYGLLLGIAARWRHSLLPCIACHISIDVAGGLWR
jgi:membrane protease YdiL (CAAX protease family)